MGYSRDLPFNRIVLIAALLAGAVPTVALAASNGSTTASFTRADWSDEATASIPKNVLDMALGATTCAVRKGAVAVPRTLTVIDYSKPSTEKRLWVLDLNTHAVLYEELVAHGQGSGGNVATRFSNQNDSHTTSLGLYVAEEAYVGKDGYALRLEGLDRGVNDKARERAIVMHGAWYVSEAFVKKYGYLGRSWGCPAVSAEVARALIDRVKGGGLVFAYYPDQNWLKSSKYLGGCAS